MTRDYDGAGAHPTGTGRLLDLLEDRLVDYRAVVHRSAPDGVADAVAAAPGAAPREPGRRPRGVPAGVAGDAAGRRAGRRRAAAVAGRARRRSTACVTDLPGRDRRPPARSCSTPGRARAGARCSLVPDLHVVVVAAADVVRNVPDALPLLDPRTAADLDQRAERDQRHRAVPGRGRPRPAAPRGGAGTALSLLNSGLSMSKSAAAAPTSPVRAHPTTRRHRAARRQERCDLRRRRGDRRGGGQGLRPRGGPRVRRRPHPRAAGADRGRDPGGRRPRRRRGGRRPRRGRGGRPHRPRRGRGRQPRRLVQRHRRRRRPGHADDRDVDRRLPAADRDRDPLDVRHRARGGAAHGAAGLGGRPPLRR